MHDAVIIEKTALESRVSNLTQEVVDLQIKADSADRLQVGLLFTLHLFLMFAMNYPFV